MQYGEYKQLRARGLVNAGVEQSTALRLIHHLPRRYQYAHAFWSFVWVLSIPFFIVAAFFTYGLALLGLLFISPLIFRATKKSAADFVLEHAEANEDFFNSAVRSGALVFQRTGGREMGSSPPPLPPPPLP